MAPFWIVLFAAVATSLAGQTLLKAAAGMQTFAAQLLDLRTILGLLLYGGAAMLYIIALRRIPMSVALPCTAISYIAAAAIGHYAFAEAITPQRIAGIALIAVGVVVLATG